jgi:flagellar motor switch protein FliG
MKAAINNRILNTYMAFLETLSPGEKLDIISKLTQSLKSEVKSKDNLFESSFGAWAGNESAEEITKGIRESRTFNRQIEGL